MAERAVSFVAPGSPRVVADRVELALRRAGWRVQRDGDVGGTAADGHPVAHLVVGGLAPVHRLRWRVDRDPTGELVVTLTRTTDGAFGGVIGRRRVRQRFDETVDAVRSLVTASLEASSSSGSGR